MDGRWKAGGTLIHEYQTVSHCRTVPNPYSYGMMQTVLTIVRVVTATSSVGSCHGCRLCKDILTTEEVRSRQGKRAFHLEIVPLVRSRS